MSDTFIIGLDFGTESARGALISTATGTVVETHIAAYAHGVMTEALPDKTPLGADWALQHAPDYTDAAADVLSRLGKGRRILSIGLDFTASSPLPTLADGTPLSVRHPDQPHAYVKLWKHHAAEAWAERINTAAPAFLKRYGGMTSSEWVFAKAWQLAEEAPDLWAESACFIEGGDWVVWQLTGQQVRSACQAGFKAHYQAPEGYPAALIPGLAAKLQEPVAVGEAAGTLTESWCERTGIIGPCTVAVSVIDAHAVLPAVGATDAGTLVGALGTSACYILLDTEGREMPGISGVVDNGAISGLWAYEAGQAAFGDALGWFVSRFPVGNSSAATFAHYDKAVTEIPLTANRPLALDWWNGCRVPLSDSALSGLFVGMTLRTSPASLYLAMLESLCFGARSIIETFRAGGAPVKRLIMTSGIAERNPFLMQLMANVLGEPVEVPNLSHSTAIGAAIHGAVAAGVSANYTEAAARFGARDARTFTPDARVRDSLDRRYQWYLDLSRNAALRSVMHGLAGQR